MRNTIQDPAGNGRKLARSPKGSLTSGGSFFHPLTPLPPWSEGLCPKDNTQVLRMERGRKTIPLPSSRNS